MKRTNEFAAVIQTIFPKMVKSCPWLFLLSGLCSIANSLCMGVLIYYSQELYDTLLKAVGGSADRTEVIGTALFFGGVTVANQVLNGLSVYIMNVMFDIIKQDLTYELHAKADRLKAVSFENETIFNQLQMAIQGRDESIFLLFICFTPLTCHLPLYLFMAAYLHTLNPKFVWGILLIFLPICISYLYKIRAKSKLVDSAAEPRRKMDYYYQCITGREYFKETRLLGAIPFFKGLFEQSMEVVNQLEKTFHTKSLRIDLVSKLITIAGYGVVLYLLVNDVLIGAVSVGAFAAALNGIGLLFDEMKELIGSDIGENIGSVGAIKNLVRFLDLSESEDSAKQADATDFSAETICLKNISFQYPNAKEYALKNIDLEIKPGEKIALVGENGSGKTTLSKILLGLYEPTYGEITRKNRHKTAISTAERKLNSAVFQDFRRYKMTLKENIAISDTSVSIDQEYIGDISKKVGISLDIDAKLGVEFGGIDLSGGQWQRIAIARGLYRKHDLIVLDEPTAAIDPLEESAIYQQFIKIIREKTAVLVTHRIGSAQIADRIIVLDQGRCIDSGTHQQLMERCELYRKMYSAQAVLYRD